MGTILSTGLQLVQSSTWWQGLAAPQQARVLDTIRVKEVDEDGVICQKNELVETWTGIATGLAKIASSSHDGKGATLSGLPPGSWFGEGSLLKSEIRRYEVIAIRPSIVAMMPKTTFDWLLDSSISFNRFLLSQLNERLGMFIATVESGRLASPEGRVASSLAQLFNPLLFPGVQPTLEISQSEVGLLTGLSRQRANQALQTLEKALLLKVDYGSITVLDLAGLRQFESTSLANQ
jgi:CRP/FNR family transcriptional regulator, cyclic AMP receptor protein